MEWLVAIALGATAGLHVATWGMYKDAPHEGFGARRYLRSAFVGVGAGLVTYPLSGLDLTEPGSIAVFWGFVYVLERAAVEFYKTFVREEDQSKYFIPMAFAVGGRVVHSRRRRVLIGVGYALGVAAIAGAILALDRSGIEFSQAALVAIGSLGGWISAFGGAWKDAPHEGFELLKFFRSPLIAALYALMLSQYTDNLVLVTFPALGYTIATIETYKTFFFPHKPRGKFAGKPIRFPEMLVRRQRFVPLYVAIWAGVIAVNALALAA